MLYKIIKFLLEEEIKEICIYLYKQNKNIIIQLICDSLLIK